MPINSKIHALISNGSKLFIGTDSGVFSSTNNGTSWSDASTGLTPNNTNAFAIIDTNIFAGNSGGVFVSNGDGSWKAASAGLPWGVSVLAAVDTNLFAYCADTGIFISTNKGSSWTATNFVLGMSSIYQSVMGSSVTAFAVSGKILFAGTCCGDPEWYTNNVGPLTGDVSGDFTNLPLLFDFTNNAHVNALAICGSYLFASINNYTDNNSGGFPCNGVWRVHFISTADVIMHSLISPDIQCYPNPLSQSTTITFSSPESGVAEVTIINLLGTQVARLFEGEPAAGEHTFAWNASRFAPCAYWSIVRMNGRVVQVPIELK